MSAVSHQTVQDYKLRYKFDQRFHLKYIIILDHLKTRETYRLRSFLPAVQASIVADPRAYIACMYRILIGKGY